MYTKMPGFVRTIQETVNTASMRLAVLATIALYAYIDPAPASAQDSLDAFDAKPRDDWTAPFKGLTSMIAGNLKSIAIVASAIMLPAIIIMVILNSRNTQKAKGWMQAGVYVLGGLLAVLWLSVAVKAIIVSPQEANAK